MAGRADSGAVLTGKRRRADSSCDAAAVVPVAEEGGQHRRQVKRQRSRTEHGGPDTHWKPAPHPDLWPVGHATSAMYQAASGNNDINRADDNSHMHHFPHPASRLLYAGSLATPATSPPSQGASSSADGCDDDMDQNMDEDSDDDIDPSSEYYNINMLLKRLHEERELRRQQRHAQSECSPG
ncbi:hypothetical protein GGF42_004917 [Coemansia sp. RSA 2424]|nr:hypothetical protein GGF42_004917 [Coemansia sp. RSA 2424]